MYQSYHGYGLGFQYPAHWELDEQSREDGVAITIQSEATSFWSITLSFDRPASADVLAAAIEVFREVYKDIDQHAAQETVCHRPTLAADLEFVCMELINSAHIRVFETNDFTALVLYQGTDREMDEVRPELEAISQSLHYHHE